MPINEQTQRSDLDVFSRFEEPSWRGIRFPCGPTSFSFDQQHAVHTYPDRDAGYIEATGRNPIVFQFTAIFRNGIALYGNADLFPDRYRKFMAACADRTTGELFHPDLGKIKAKCKSFRPTYDPARRDGVDVDVEFIESTDRADELDALLKQSSPLGDCIATARDIDSSFTEVERPKIPERLKPSLLESMKQLSGLVAQTRMGIGNVSAQIQGYASAVNDLTDQIIALDNPKNYQAIQALEKLFAALVRLGDEVTARSRPLRPVTLLRDMAISEAANQYETPIADFCRINPLVASRETLRSGTLVFVFA